MKQYNQGDTIQIGKYLTEIREYGGTYFLYSSTCTSTYGHLEDIYRQFGLKKEDIQNIYGYVSDGGFPFARSLKDLNKTIHYLLSFVDQKQYKLEDTIHIGKHKVKVQKHSNNQYYLHIPSGLSNAVIYEQLNLTRHDIQTVYGYSSNGDFPQANSIEDLNKAINYLLNLSEVKEPEHEKETETKPYRIDKTVDGEIIKVTKVSTGEQFTKGDTLYHNEYDKLIGPIWFDEALTGKTFFGDQYYEGYIRAHSGLYPIDKLFEVPQKEKNDLTDELPQHVKDHFKTKRENVSHYNQEYLDAYDHFYSDLFN